MHLASMGAPIWNIHFLLQRAWCARRCMPLQQSLVHFSIRHHLQTPEQHCSSTIAHCIAEADEWPPRQGIGYNGRILS